MDCSLPCDAGRDYGRYGRDDALSEMAGVMAVWLELAEQDGYSPLPETPRLLADAIAEVLADRVECGWDPVIETTMLAPAVPAAAWFQLRRLAGFSGRQIQRVAESLGWNTSEPLATT